MLAAAVSAFSPEELAFEKFQTEFSKNYSEEEKATRFQNFKKNLADVVKTNSQDLPWEFWPYDSDSDDEG